MTSSHNIMTTPPPSSSSYNTTHENITLENVHKCSTFTLRQELERRGVVNFQNQNVNNDSSSEREVDEDIAGVNVTYEGLLQKMIEILYNEQTMKENRTHGIGEYINEENNNDETDDNDRETNETISERLLRLRMERKKEAIERSKQRQLNKDYFESKKIANEQGLIDHEERLKHQRKKSDDTDEGCSNDLNKVDHDSDSTVDEEDSNPFALRFRSKIGGKSLI